MKMNRLFTLLITLLLITSCGSDSGGDVILVDGEAEKLSTLSDCEECREHANNFDKDFDTNSSDLRIVFDSLGENRAGVCYAFDSGEPYYIAVDSEEWGKLTPLQKELLIYHELGHCMLGLDHIDEMESVLSEEGSLRANLKLSIMHSSLFDVFQVAYYQIFKEDYKDALVNNTFIIPDLIPVSELNQVHLEDISEFNVPITNQYGAVTDDSVVTNKRLYTFELCANSGLRVIKSFNVLSSYNRCL